MTFERFSPGRSLQLLPRLALVLTTALLVAACQSSGGYSGRSALATADVADDPRYAALIIDAATGETLYSVDADEYRYPASLTKMMTLYLFFEALEDGRIDPRQALPVSANAASQPPSRLGLRAGSAIAVDDALRAISVRSSNDVAIVVAEAVAGSEAAFVARMNAKAAMLGLGRTRFTNPTGLPDPGQRTSARDMARMARALQLRFPQYYPYFSLRGFSYAGREYQSTNQLLGEVRGMDGIKTGYIRDSGYNLATSVSRGGRRIIIVVMGGRSAKARNDHVAELAERYI